MLNACKNKTGGNEAINNETKTPVTITHIISGPLKETIILNATSSFLVKTNIKSNATGYLETTRLNVGQYVNKGETLFIIKTKEATAVGNTINSLDSSFHFNNTIQIKTNISGYLSAINFQSGDFVQEGDALVMVSEASSFVFLLELPFELKKYISTNTHPELELADGRKLQGTIKTAMPSVDIATQTQQYQIKVSNNIMIPENLIAKVKLIKEEKNNGISLPKEAILTNETQDQFWVMKLINDSTAVKIPIKKGIETEAFVEVVSPIFNSSDKIVISGNYGLEDTAKVIVKIKE